MFIIKGVRHRVPNVSLARACSGRQVSPAPVGHLWGRCGTPGQGLPFKTPCWMCGNLDPERSLFPRPQRGRGQEARPEQAGPDPRLPSLGHCVLVVGVGRPEAARIEKGAAPQSLSPQDASKSVYGK